MLQQRHKRHWQPMAAYRTQIALHWCALLRKVCELLITRLRTVMIEGWTTKATQSTTISRSTPKKCWQQELRGLHAIPPMMLTSFYREYPKFGLRSRFHLDSGRPLSLGLSNRCSTPQRFTLRSVLLSDSQRTRHHLAPRAPSLSRPQRLEEAPQRKAGSSTRMFQVAGRLPAAFACGGNQQQVFWSCWHPLLPR
jgi:hypothetical protein